MSKPWSDLTPREKDARVAEAMGWVLVDETPHPEHRKRGQVTDLWYQESGGMLWRIPHNRERINYATDFCPTVSLDHARLVLDEIKRRELQSPYVRELVEILGIYGDGEYYDWDRQWGAAVWAILDATPDQRCEAAVTVLEAGDKPSK